MKAGWEIKRVAEIAECSLGKMLDKNKNKGTLRRYLRNLNVRWFEFDLSDVLEMKFEGHELERYAVRLGDLVVCEGGYPGRAAIWSEGEPILIQKALHRVRCKQPETAKWLLYFLNMKALDGSLSEHFTGSGIQHFTRAALSKLKVPIPPLEEQKRIVAVLDEAFEGLSRARANAEANLVDVQELFEGFVADALSHPKQNWISRPLGSLCKRITVGHVGPMANRYTEAGIPFLRSQNIRPFRVDRAGLKFIGPDFMAELGKSELRAGDVAIVRTGYPGTCAVIPDDMEIANCADLVIARTGPDLDPHFMALLLNSRFGKAHVADVSVGAAQKHFNVGAAKAAVFAIPPVKTQRDIVERAQEVMAMVANLQNIYEHDEMSLNALRQSLLQKAFAGELT